MFDWVWGWLECIVDVGWCVVFEFVEQFCEWYEWVIVQCDFVCICEEVWQVVQVVWFVVVVVDVCEQVEDFDVVLQFYLFELVVEFVEIWIDWQVGFFCFFLVICEVVEFEFFVLVDECVVQQ